MTRLATAADAVSTRARIASRQPVADYRATATSDVLPRMDIDCFVNPKSVWLGGYGWVILPGQPAFGHPLAYRGDAWRTSDDFRRGLAIWW
jgi:hypothetical protein